MCGVQAECSAERKVSPYQTARYHKPEDHSVKSTDDENKENAREIMYLEDTMILLKCIRAFTRLFFFK